MRLVKVKIRVFVKILMLEKQNSTNFTHLRQLLIGFTEINISDHKPDKHYFHMLAELNKMFFSATPHLRQD